MPTMTMEEKAREYGRLVARLRPEALRRQRSGKKCEPYRYVAAKRQEEKFVYFVFAPRSGRLKIGVARDPEERLVSLQCGSPDELKLLGTLPGGHNEERRLHRRFDHLRSHGEWFHYRDELKQFIGKYMSRRK